TGSFGPYGCPENLSVRFFPNSAGSPGTHCVNADEVEKGTTEVQCQVPHDLPKFDKSMKIN
ncbi:hypothetical protein KUU22_27020, partial [Pseudomonas aeruginosa]|nr:hypothetical protein [Pseudomonas aeruginosa]